jgi:hypothetical protein
LDDGLQDLPFIESGSHVDKYIYQIDMAGPKCDYSVLAHFGHTTKPSSVAGAMRRELLNRS